MENDELPSLVNEGCGEKCGLQDETKETTENLPLSNSNGEPSNQKTIHSEVENYLDQVSSYVSESFDPKLKREYKKLADLLHSYRKLNNKLKCGEETKKTAPEETLKGSPEIRAILQPEIYANIREIEKETLVSKFAKKNFHNDPIPRCYKAPPSINLYDLRQIEKDRFAQVLSSAPSRFHNLLPKNPLPKRPISANALRGSMEVVNEREKEKDRLARIFASSISQKKNVSKNNTKRPPLISKQIEQNNKSKSSSSSVSFAPAVNNRESPPNRKIEAESLEKLKEKSPDNPDNCGMVRAGEYSPLNNRDNPQGKHLLGFGEYEERRKLSLERRKKEYRDYITQIRQAAKTKMDAQVSTGERINSEDESKFRSISTQTDFEQSLSPRSTVSFSDQAKGSPESNAHSPSAPLHPNVPFITPREKLLSDLHGASDFFAPVENPHSFSSGDDARLKQMAYAEALRAQIEEKKRLDSLRKQKERDEEEMLERKAMEQQERLQKEYQKEQLQRLDWMQQRAAQEELLRQRLLEMELQAKELKKEERRKKRSQSHYDDTLHEEYNQGDLHDPDIWLEVDSNRHLEQMTRAPLLDADLQNVLSDKYYAHHSPRNVRVSPQEPAVRSVAVSPRSSLIYNPLYATMTGDNTEVAPPQRQRSLSPVIPALRTESLLKKNTQLLSDKWMVPPRVSIQGVSAAHGLPGDNMSKPDTILTQLGAFRRQLHLEHLRMQQRLETQPSQ